MIDAISKLLNVLSLTRSCPSQMGFHPRGCNTCSFNYLQRCHALAAQFMYVRRFRHANTLALDSKINTSFILLCVTAMTPVPFIHAALVRTLGNVIMLAGILIFLVAASAGGHLCFKRPTCIEGGQRAFIRHEGTLDWIDSGIVTIVIEK